MFDIFIRLRRRGLGSRDPLLVRSRTFCQLPHKIALFTIIRILPHNYIKSAQKHIIFIGHLQGSHSTMKTMKMELNHENHEKTMKIRICPKKNMKTEIPGQNFPKICTYSGQNDQKFSPAEAS